MLEIKIIETIEDLEKALKIRREVFVEEHNVPESIELDEFDTLGVGCTHFLALYDNKPVGTLRANLTIKDTVKIQRFCFLPEYRKSGFGKLLLDFAEKELLTKGYKYFFLEAKFSVHPFYEKCGYTACFFFNKCCAERSRNTTTTAATCLNIINLTEFT